MHAGDGQVNRKERLAEASEALAPQLLAYFVRRVIPREDAADLLAETLLIAWRKARALPDDPDLHRAWMFSTAAKVLANHRRGNSRRDRLTQRIRDHLQSEPDQLVEVDLRLEVQSAIDSLTPQDAELVRLVYWEGFSASEAGATLGIPASTARLKMSEARTKLAVLLETTIGS